MAKQKLDNGEAVDYRDSGLGTKFLKLLNARQEQSQIRKNAEKEEKVLNQQLTQMLAEKGHKTVITPDWRVTFYQGTHSQINGRKLAELGVPIKTIEKATVKTTYETVNVTAVKNGDAA